MTFNFFYKSVDEVTIPDHLEMITQSSMYSDLSKWESQILTYKIDTTCEEDVLGFYTHTDFPDEDTVIIECCNADLKNWLIFYGAPEPFTSEWKDVVFHHRDRSLQEICAANYYRWSEFREMIEHPEARQ